MTTEICGTRPRQLDAARGRSARTRPGPHALLQAGAAGLDEADDRRPGSPARRITPHDRVGVGAAQRAAREAAVLRVAVDRPAGDGARAGDDAVPGAARARCASATPVRIAMKRAGVAQGSRRSRGVRLARGSAVLWRRRSCARCTGPRCGRRSRTSSRSPTRPAVAVRGPAERARLVRDVVEVEALVGLAVAERRRRDAAAQGAEGRDRLDRAGGAEQVADRRLGRRDRDARRARRARA